MNLDTYVGSFDALYTTLVETGRYTMTHGNAITALYLAWIGFKVDQAPYVLKRHVDNAGQVWNEAKHAFLVLPSPAADFIREYASYKHGNIRTYSPFLLQTKILAQLAVQNIRVAVQELMFGADRRVTYDSVYWSGIFNRATQVERGMNGLPEYSIGHPLDARQRALYEYVFDRPLADTAQVRYMVGRYEKYKARFHPEMTHAKDRPTRITERELSMLRTLYLEGVPVKDIAEAVGRPYSSTRNALTNHGISSNEQFAKLRAAAIERKKNKE